MAHLSFSIENCVRQSNCIQKLLTVVPMQFTWKMERYQQDFNSDWRTNAADCYPAFIGDRLKRIDGQTSNENQPL